jgi:hypothetical protein
MPVKIKGREIGKSEFDNWEVLINGKWQDFTPPYDENLKATTVNERLFLSGLLDEYEKALKQDKEKAKKILVGLEIDTDSIEQIFPPLSPICKRGVIRVRIILPQKQAKTIGIEMNVGMRKLKNILKKN